MPTSIKNKKNIELIVLSIFIFLFFSPVILAGQKSLSWVTLSDVTFKEVYDEKAKWYWLVPIFGEKAKAFQNKKVVLEGYFIPVDPERNFHVLSRYPYSSCFFCGGAGPESVVELQIDKKLAKHISMDERIRFEGELILNDSDFDHCSYILKAARPAASIKP